MVNSTPRDCWSMSLNASLVFPLGRFVHAASPCLRGFLIVACALTTRDVGSVAFANRLRDGAYTARMLTLYAPRLGWSYWRNTVT